MKIITILCPTEMAKSLETLKFRRMEKHPSESSKTAPELSHTTKAGWEVLGILFFCFGLGFFFFWKSVGKLDKY